MKSIILSILILFSITNGSNAAQSEDFHDHVISENGLNKAATQSALHSYDLINKNWAYAIQPADFTAGVDCWRTDVIPTPQHGNVPVIVWDQAKEPQMGVALDCLLGSKTRAECLNALKIVKVRIIASLLGKESFNDLITTLLKRNDAPHIFFHKLAWSFQTLCTSDFKGFCVMSFVNIPEYVAFKPKGDARNHNVIRLCDGNFIGFDPMFFQEARTYDDLEKYMYDLFVSERFVEPGLIAEHKAFCDDLTFEKFQVLRREYQSKQATYAFDLQKIADFVEKGKI
ncbi:MAG: hypothetical protein K2Y18_08715 [Alphaproteobacteria bacterium]|jgi:hypothetical protein|nr:hypothetical protein [Alphaproteobacteria bacterium]